MKQETKNELVDWIANRYTSAELQKIVTHGVGDSWPNLTFHFEAAQVYRLFQDEIWELAIQASKEMKYKNVLKFISSFDDAANIVNEATFQRLMVWFAVEECARRLIDQTEINEKNIEKALSD
jgi:hypothetical protein